MNEVVATIFPSYPHHVHPTSLVWSFSNCLLPILPSSFSSRQGNAFLLAISLFCFPDKYSIPHPARCRRRKSLYVQPPLAALGWRLTFSSPLPASPWLRPTALVLSRRPQRVLWTLTMNPRTPGTRLRQQQPQPQHRLLNRPLLRLRRLPRQSPRDP